MPFYDLHCNECEKEFNIRATISEKSEKLIKCPECGSNDLKSVYKSANFYVNGLKNEKASECPNINVCGAGCPHSQRA